MAMTDGPALTLREQRILDGIEERLRADTELDRRLSTMRLHRLWHLWLFLRGSRGAVALVLVVAAGVLLAAEVPGRPGPAALVAVVLLLLLAGTVLIPRLGVERRRADRPGPEDGWGRAA
ncbi:MULTISPECIES: hypothetical protein [Streptacidiphilus]|uniref:DUF3040 domain-containing protein n=1 Tax=Streptacidiphilus cavernicola TaxID=3342716 RepID=A0ABV6UJB2_9ACTN|nr:hypothetical protein [Streptacidiphilus jeojiense]